MFSCVSVMSESLRGIIKREVLFECVLILSVRAAVIIYI